MRRGRDDTVAFEQPLAMFGLQDICDRATRYVATFDQDALGAAVEQDVGSPPLSIHPVDRLAGQYFSFWSVWR